MIITNINNNKHHHPLTPPSPPPPPSYLNNNNNIIRTSRRLSNPSTNNNNINNLATTTTTSLTTLPKLSSNNTNHYSTANNNNHARRRSSSFIYRLADSDDLVVYDAKQETIKHEEYTKLEKKLKESEIARQKLIHDLSTRDEYITRLQEELTQIKESLSVENDAHEQKLCELNETKQMLTRALLESVEKSDETNKMIEELEMKLHVAETNLVENERIVKELRRVVKSQKNEMIALSSKASTLEKTLEVQTKTLEHLLVVGGGTNNNNNNNYNNSPTGGNNTNHNNNKNYTTTTTNNNTLATTTELVVVVEIRKGEEYNIILHEYDNPKEIVYSFAKSKHLRSTSITKLMTFVTDQFIQTFGEIKKI
jgi:chromosome segregation ATPase